MDGRKPQVSLRNVFLCFFRVTTTTNARLPWLHLKEAIFPLKYSLCQLRICKCWQDDGWQPKAKCLKNGTKWKDRCLSFCTNTNKIPNTNTFLNTNKNTKTMRRPASLENGTKWKDRCASTPFPAACLSPLLTHCTDYIQRFYNLRL